MYLHKLFVLLAVALSLCVSPAHSQQSNQSCIPKENQPIADSLSNQPGGYIVLMRHAYARCNSGKTQAKPKGCIGAEGRHLCGTTQTRYMAAQINSVLKGSGKPFKISKIMTSRICRTIETANILRPIIQPNGKASPSTRHLDPYKIQRQRLLKQPALSTSEANKKILDEAAQWIRQLDPSPGEIIVLVSHSDIIPDIIPKLDYSKRPLSKMIPANTESIFLRKTVEGFECVATIPLR